MLIICKYLILLSFIFMLRGGYISCGTLHVTITEDNGTVQEWTEEYLPGANFELRNKRNLDDYLDESLVEDDFESEGNRQETCIKSKPNEGSRHSAHVAHMASFGETIRLPCHYCSDPDAEVLSGHIWYRYTHKNIGDIKEWRAIEVNLDMEDNDKDNRVFTEADHTLVIRDFKYTDKGSYFCLKYDPTRDTNRKFVFQRGAFNAISAVSLAAAIWESEKGNEEVEFLHHVDIRLNLKATLVTSDGVGYPKPAPPMRHSRDNWQASMSWGEWGECNVCGRPGERRRYGECWITAVDPDVEVLDHYVALVLEMYPDGAACHSSLFMHLGGVLMNIIDEVEIGRCYTTCRVKKQITSANIAGSQIVKRSNEDTKQENEVKFEIPKEKPKVDKRTILKREGDGVFFKCPSTKPGTVVQWQNKSEVVQSIDLAISTSNRMEIDASGTFIIKDIIGSDATVLKCHHTGYLRGEYTFIVGYTFKLTDPGPYLLYLYYSYAANTGIFTIIMVARHCLRKPPKRRRRRRRRNVNNSNIGGFVTGESDEELFKSCPDDFDRVACSDAHSK